MYKAMFIYLVLILLMVNNANARPEYAARAKAASCTMCHASPLGGNIKNATGKAFALHGLNINQFSTQDKWAVDFRGLYYSPDHRRANPSGAAIMGATVGVNLDISDLASGDASKTKTHFVAQHNIGGFSKGGAQEIYLKWQFKEDYEDSFAPQYLMVGRTHRAFGLLTDEHRTYTKMQTATLWYNHEAGVTVSGNPLNTLHYDLQLTDGQNNNAGISDLTTIPYDWAGIANLRWTPATLPFVLGASYSYHNNAITNSQSAKAHALYGVVVLDGLTNGIVPWTINMEMVEASFWNWSLASTNLLTDPTTTLSGLMDKTSQGYLIQSTITLTNSWELILKLDSLALDKENKGDRFIRHGIGIKHYLSGAVNIQARYEEAEAKDINQKNSTAVGNEDAFLLLMRVSL